MTGPAAKTTANEIIRDINLLMRLENPPELNVKRLAKDAERLENANINKALIAQSAVAALMWDGADALDLVQRAIRNSNDHVDTINGAVTLTNVNDVINAKIIIDKIVDMAPTDQSVFCKSIGIYLANGDLSGAARIYRNAQQFGTVDITNTTDAVAAHEAASQLGITESKIRNEMSLAFKVLTGARLRFTSLDIDVIDQTGNAEALSFVVHCTARDQGTLSNIERKLAVELSKIESWDPRVLSIEFDCANDQELELTEAENGH